MLTTTVAGRTWNFSHAIGRNAAAGNGFTQPWDVAAGPDGVLYVLSRGQEGVGGVTAENKRIGKLTIDQEFIGDFARGMTWPAGIALDSSGNIYCSEEFQNKIFVFNEDGEEIGSWGEAGSGQGQLNSPSGLAVDGDDNLLVVDARNNRIQKFTTGGEYIATIGEGQLDSPWGIGLDSDGNIYVADWGNSCVRKYSAAGVPLLTFGGPDLDNGADLNHPSSVAVDSEGDVYVADWGNKRIQIYAPDGAVITALHGDAVEFSNWAAEVINSNPDAQKAYRRVKDRTSLGLFERPVGMAIDSEDRIIVTDSTRGRLQIYAKEKDYMDPQFNL
jgi:DNA-binding beta-propeller fold protein YncE